MWTFDTASLNAGGGLPINRKRVSNMVLPIEVIFHAGALSEKEIRSELGRWEKFCSGSGQCDL